MHQGQYPAAQAQRHAVIRTVGIAVPDVIQQGKRHFPGARVDGQREVIHPTGTAGDDVTHLVQHDGLTLPSGSLRIHRKQAADHVAARERQTITNRARPIGPEGRIELGLHGGSTQAGTGDAITARTAQRCQAFVYKHTAHTF